MHTPAETKITAQDVQDAFIAAEREALPLDRAAHVARHIIAWGQNARRAFDGAERHLRGDYLAYIAALEEARDLAKRAARMRWEAANLDHRADQHLATSVEYQGRADYQRQRGEADTADNFQSMAEAAMANYREAEAAAFRLKLRACELETQVDLINGAFEIAGAA